VRDILQTLDRLGVAAAAMESDRRLVEANATLKQLLGLGPDDGIGVDIGAAIANGATDHIAFGLSTLYRFSSEPQSPWFRLDLKSVDQAFVGILTDVGREHAPREEAAHFNETRNKLLHDGKVGVWRYDPDAELYYFSSELSLGHEGAGSGVPVALLKILQHPDDQEKDNEIRERIVREGGTANAEMRYRGADGSYTHLNVHYRAGRQLASGRYEMFGISQDITAIAQARDEASQLSDRLSAALRQADYANRSKTEFLANMSHELRTPLNAILGFSEILESQMFGPVGSKYVGYAHDIHRSGQHLLELVNDVLDLAKLEAGKLEIRESDIAIADLIDDCLTLVRGKADAGRVRLSKEHLTAVPKVRGDERAVKQVLLNFLSNAIKFTPNGGAVSVAASVDADGRFCLSVKDSGIGMTEAEIAVALSPFGQIDSKLARKHQGTGLGLPISRSLMELHGGEVTIQSAPNTGTTLTACFPTGRVLMDQAA
jgi:signal transduction histidine kinase